MSSSQFRLCWSRKKREVAARRAVCRASRLPCSRCTCTDAGTDAATPCRSRRWRWHHPDCPTSSARSDASCDSWPSCGSKPPRTPSYSRPKSWKTRSCSQKTYKRGCLFKENRALALLGQRLKVCQPVMWSETVGLRTTPVWDQKIGLGLSFGLVRCVLGLGLAGLVLFCATRSCSARHHNDLEGHSNF